MNDTEQLIKDALGKLAERTPHPGPTLNALRRKRKRQRNNVFLIATAGMAAVAVLIFTGLIASDRYTPPNHNDAAAALMPTNVNGQSFELKYAPHWLPDGFVENYRSVGPEVTRVWVPVSAKDRNPMEQTGDPRVTLRKLKKLPDGLDQWQEVTVRGLKAWQKSSQGQSAGLTTEVVWQAQDALSVTLRGVTDASEAALRVADSVRADSNLSFLPPFWLDGKAAADVWGSSPYDWSARWAGEKFGVTVSTRQPAKTEGALATVRGQKGTVVNDSAVVVRDSSGFWITVEGAPGARDSLVEAANRVQLQIVPSPDTIWIGKGL
ncbi:hypothetical protein ACIA8G_16675 [Lentzea sp. NPDC051213]|uniref:hypothetical protein n=1 Tax=Lentzea sp. NPDC051213 TaxID=3364126 RepID=UPI00379A8A41